MRCSPLAVIVPLLAVTLLASEASPAAYVRDPMGEIFSRRLDGVGASIPPMSTTEP